MKNVNILGKQKKYLNTYVNLLKSKFTKEIIFILFIYLGKLLFIY